MDEAATGSAATSKGARGRREPALPTIPYARHEIDASDVDAVVAALRSERLTQGPEPERFERAICDRLGVANAVVVSTGVGCGRKE